MAETKANAQRHEVREMLTPSFWRYAGVTSVLSIFSFVLVMIVTWFFPDNPNFFLLGALLPDSVPHQIQMGYTLSVYFAPLLAAALALEWYVWEQRKKGSPVARRAFVYFGVFVLSMLLVHVNLWWGIQPTCVQGCRDDVEDVIFSIAWFFAAIVPWISVIISALLYAIARKKKITRWSIEFTVLYLALLPSLWLIAGPLVFALSVPFLVLSAVGAIAL